jgi:phosphatidylserine/phosphatidylglycerophosphate/cardiolipin synthase-like enzyme
VIFNRAAAASQAYARRFDAANPEEDKEAREWLSRGLMEKLFAFIKRAKDSDYTLDMAIYEIELKDVVSLLRKARKAGADIRVVYHAKKNDHQTDVNEAFLKRLPKGVKTARVTSAIFHQKFIVLGRKLSNGTVRPISVLTGTANFTPNGTYRQANVIHVVEDKTLAAEYLHLFDELFAGATPRDTKQFINANGPIFTKPPQQVVFSPGSGFVDLNEISSLIKKARKDVMFCTAFKLHDTITAALLPKSSDDVIRYGLQNTRSKITGIHRDKNALFTATAFLNKGLEHFLKESTAGQRGNILIHLKTIVCDFTTNDPVVISGSNNFSASASAKNDENVLILKGKEARDVVDTYLCEMMRLYDHYRFRFNQKSKKKRGVRSRLTLVANDKWTNHYFKRGSRKALERRRFCS